MKTISTHPRATTVAPVTGSTHRSLTRRTARFARLAGQLEDACAARGVRLDPGRIDEILNHQIDRVATANSVSKRTALRDLQPAAIGPLAADVARYADLARHLGDACTARGLQLDPADIDAVLRNQIAHLASSLSVGTRTALRHLDRAAVGTLADDVARMTEYLHGLPR